MRKDLIARMASGASAAPVRRPDVRGDLLAAMPKPDRRCACGGGCPRCRDADASTAALRALSGIGEPLGAATRAYFEPRFGRSLADVRIHRGAAAERAAASLGALAFAHGDDIGVATHAPALGTPGGHALLAHELAHVAQQRGAPAGSADAAVQRGDAPEQQAREASREALHLPPRPIRVSATPRALRLAEPDDVAGGGLGPRFDAGGGLQLQLLTTGATPELPQWIPADLRERIAAGSLPPGATRWPGEAPWGDIVMWVGAPSVAQHIEVYQEWPEDQAFYLEPAGDSAFLAGVLRDANATINRDMRTLVVEQGMAPSRARDRLRAVYDEVLVLVIDATVTALATSGGINVGALESKTDEIARAAQRRAAAGGGAALEGVVPAAETRIAPVDGCVNVGGVSERIGDWSDWTNLNANLQNWDLSSVRNLVVGRGEDMASLFVPGSVRAIASRRLPYDSTDVPAFARAAYEVMAEGGTLDLNFFGMLEIHEEVAAAFTAAGFKDVEVVDGVRVLGNR